MYLGRHYLALEFNMLIVSPKLSAEKIIDVFALCSAL